MKVLYILPILSYRGAERVALHALATPQAIKSESVAFFLSKSKQIPTDQLSVKSLSRAYFPHDILGTLLKYPLALLIVGPIVTILYGIILCKKLKIECIQTESYPCNVPSLIIAKVLKIKVVWIIHDIAVSPPINSLNVRDLLSKIIFKLDTYVGENVNHIITVSPKTSMKVEKRFKQTPHTMIIPPINMSRLEQQTEIPSLHVNSKLVLLIVGALHTLKNQQLGVKILSLLKESHPNTQLICVGSGDSSEVRKIATLKNLRVSEDSNSDADIILTGFISDAHIADYYQKATVTLITSLDEGEGLGITAFESYYKKKPCIATSCSGVTKVFSENGFGFACDPNEEEFVKILKRVCNDYKVYQDDANKGFRYVQKNLTVEAFGKNLNEVYSTRIHAV